MSGSRRRSGMITFSMHDRRRRRNNMRKRKRRRRNMNMNMNRSRRTILCRNNIARFGLLVVLLVRMAWRKPHKYHSSSAGSFDVYSV